jgi:hypothetical protein
MLTYMLTYADVLDVRDNSIGSILRGAHAISSALQSPACAVKTLTYADVCRRFQDDDVC